MATAPTTRKEPLTRGEFERICFEASRSSTSSAGYLCGVFERVCLRMGVDSTLFTPCLEAHVDNLQVVVVTLYHLLSEGCRCDFDIAEVLNFYAKDLAESV